MNDFTEYIQEKDESFRYMLLSRMQSDCAYYLGNGRLYGPHLWAGNERDQIKDMKILWNSFPDDKKPEWISYEDILAFEQRLLPRYKQQQDKLDMIARHLKFEVYRPFNNLNPHDANTVYFYKRCDGQVDYKHPDFIFDNTDMNGNFSYDYACHGQFDLRYEQWGYDLSEHLMQFCSTRSDYEVHVMTPIARIDYLFCSGQVGESLYFYSENDFLIRLKKDNYHGTPMTVTLYRDSSGNTISNAFLMDMDPPIQGFSVENYHEAKEVKQT